MKKYGTDGLKSILVSLFLVFLMGCYKKDKEEFDNLKYEIKNDIALSIFDATLTIKDSLSFLSDKQYSGDLYLVNENITIGDSVGLKLNGYSVKEAELKLYLKNDFPVKGNLQVYFLDISNNKIDSLFTTKTYEVNYSTNNYVVDEIYLKMDEDKLKRIVHCHKVKVVYSLKTNSSVNNNYSLFIGCGAILKTEKTY